MRAYRVEATLTEDGSLVLNALPFRAGERVEVIVLAAPRQPNTSERYPLWGTPYRYDDPTEPIAADDWEALR